MAIGLRGLTHGSRVRATSSPPMPRGARASPASGAPARRSARPSSKSPVRPKPPTAASSATGSPKRARARQRDAHLEGRQAASSAAGHRSQTLRFSSSSPAPPGTRKERPKSPAETLTHIRRAKQQRCPIAALHGKRKFLDSLGVAARRVARPRGNRLRRTLVTSREEARWRSRSSSKRSRRRGKSTTR